MAWAEAPATQPSTQPSKVTATYALKIKPQLPAGWSISVEMNTISDAAVSQAAADAEWDRP
jgi:hypothetical protein